MDLREELLDDFGRCLSEAFCSRSPVLRVCCKHCTTVFDGFLTADLALAVVDDGRDVGLVLGEDLVLFVGFDGSEVEGFALSSSVVVLPTDRATARQLWIPQQLA